MVKTRAVARKWATDKVPNAMVAGVVKMGAHFIGVAATPSTPLMDNVIIHTADFLRMPGSSNSTAAENIVFEALSRWFAAQQELVWHASPKHVVNDVCFTQKGQSCALCSIAWFFSRVQSVGEPSSQSAAREIIMQHVDVTRL